MKHREKLWTPGPWAMGESALNNGLACVDTDYNYSQGFPMEVCATWGTDDGQNNAVTPESRANAQLISAAPDLVEEHESWASLIGEVYALIQQANYSEAKRLLDQAVTIDFKANDGAPAALSPALDKAYGQSPCKSCGDFGSTCDVCGNQGDSQ